MIRAQQPWLAAALGLFFCGALAEPVEFREPRRVRYELETRSAAIRTNAVSRWLPARTESGRKVEFGQRVVVRARPGRTPALSLLVPGLRMERQADERTWVLLARTPLEAIQAAQLLSRAADVESATPTTRRRVRRHFPIAPSPNDPYFPRQFSIHTDQPTSPYLPAAVDLNLREAWCYSRGEGVIVGVGDDGIEGTHPDLAANFAGPNHNFLTDVPNGDPVGRSLFHGTAVAGLIASVGDNRLGLTGVAPQAKLASWVIFDESDTSEPDDAGFAAMFGTANQEVGVQNHSWGNADSSFVEVSLLENIALEKAVTEGRGGRGVVLVRSAGNTRPAFASSPQGDANLDGYANDPRQITVAAVRTDGRHTSYSTPGSCVLVAAPGGDFRGGYPGLVTTDRTGTAGLNAGWDPLDPTAYDYLVGGRLFVGTSAAAPLVSGLAALIVSARPELPWHEVQQIIALSARHLDLSDEEMRTNGAGFRVSPNTGYGIPDAGAALRLALPWQVPPSREKAQHVIEQSFDIPDPHVNGSHVPLVVDLPLDKTLVVQHVRVRVRWSHRSGRELRVDLLSPMGTRSPLLRTGTADEPVPDEWTFSSVAHLGETSAGVWKLLVTDTRAGNAGQLDEIVLLVEGRGVTDSDRDGLDDDWEQRWFESLNPNPGDDPDHDGWNNAAEQMAGRHPTQPDDAFAVTVSRQDARRLRLSWPSTVEQRFEVWSAPTLNDPLTLLTNVPGRLSAAGWFFEPNGANTVFVVNQASE